MIIVHVKLPTSENNAHAVKKQRLADEIHDDVETLWNTSGSETHRVKLVYDKVCVTTIRRHRQSDRGRSFDPKLRPQVGSRCEMVKSV